VENVIYFDLETQKTFQQVGQGRHGDLKISLAVTHTLKDKAYHIWKEEDVDELVSHLFKADLVVGYNLIEFDYRVLASYTILDLTQIPTLDLMLKAQESLGHRVKLDSIATATFGFGKTGDGLDAVKWFQQGKWLEIAEYCCYDVKVTRMVHEFAQQHGKLYYFPKNDPQPRSFPISL